MKFFGLVFALSVPFWLVGARTNLRLAPDLPVGALMFVCPVIAATILVYRENGTAGVAALLKRAFDDERIRAKVWYLPVVLLLPGVYAATYGLMRLVGLPVPAPQFPVLAAAAMSVAFLFAGLTEELGWSGYAIDPMQARWTALQASLLLGLVTAAWHIVPLVQADRAPSWIAWWCLNTVTLRVLIVWLYNNTGKSVFATILFHAMSNLSMFVIPDYYDPQITGLILAVAAAIVTIVWGPRTLARYGYA